jgi:hypothetical protein
MLESAKIEFDLFFGVFMKQLLALSLICASLGAQLNAAAQTTQTTPSMPIVAQKAPVAAAPTSPTPAPAATQAISTSAAPAATPTPQAQSETPSSATKKDKKSKKKKHGKKKKHKPA